MKAQNYNLVRYDADEGKVFDWAEARFHEEPVDHDNPEGEMKQVQEHLYAKTIFIGHLDSIDNYIEVAEPAVE